MQVTRKKRKTTQKKAASVKYSQWYTTLWSTNLCTNEFMRRFAPENIHETYDG